MVLSWRDVFKFLAFVVLVAAVVFYVASNREHLIDNLTVSSSEQTAAGVGQPDASQPATGQNDAGEILSVGAFDQAALTALGSPTTDLFVEFRLQREQARSQQLDLLREILTNPNVDQQSRDEAMSLWLKITEMISAEVDLENLIRAKGFADAVVVLDNGKGTIMVKADSLTKDEVVRIADLAVRVAGLSYEDITVMARGG